MRQVTWTLILLLGQAAFASAQEDAAGVSRFFRGKRVAFWSDAKEEPPKSTQAPGGGETIWAEPIRMPDGRISVYVPPKPVLDFLDSPNEESGRAYLAWQRARMEKIARASEILGRLVEETRPLEKKKADPPPLPEAPPLAADAGAEKAPSGGDMKAPPALPSGAPEILYFKMDGCPHCRREDAVLLELAKERPDVKVRVFTPDREEALWETLEIKVVPTLVVRGGDGRLQMSRGYTSKEVLLLKLGEKK
jgi:thiol-disulfide isomerase/thioredoxin